MPPLVQRLSFEQYLLLCDEVLAAKEHLDVELRRYKRQPEIRKQIGAQFDAEWKATLLALSHAETSWRTMHHSRANVYSWIKAQIDMEQAA
jgi:hypothetical protein